MSDPITSLRNQTDVLRRALEQWANRATAVDKATAKQAARTAVDAIDALLRDLYLLRGRLVQEMRHVDGADRGRVA